MSEESPQVPPAGGLDEEHSPPKLGVEEVPAALGSSAAPETVSAESKSRLTRIKRVAKAAGKFARMGSEKRRPRGSLPQEEATVNGDKGEAETPTPPAATREAPGPTWEELLDDSIDSKGDEVEGSEPTDGPEEEIEEDTAENWTESSEARDAVISFLRKSGVDEAKIAQATDILDKDLNELVHLHLSKLGVEEEKIGEVAQLLAPRQLYLKKLHELGMPADKDEAASKSLTEEVGRLRLKHLKELVGGKEEELRELMKTHHQELLADKLKKLGLEDEKIKEISATPRRDKSKLTQEALRSLGLEDETIKGVEEIIALAEIPADIKETANRLGIPLESVAKAREAFNRADWKDTLDYLELAQRQDGAREQLRLHGIEIKPAPATETDEETRSRLANMTLKEIAEKFPEEWDVERARRVVAKKVELLRMLDKFRDYLPLDELPLPDDVEVPPEESIPKDLLGAYGLWRRLLTDSYIKRLADKNQYQKVRAEIHRVGGPPILRRIPQRWLAIRVLRTQKKEAKEHRVQANFGVFGVGYSRYKQNFRSIESLDMEAQDVLRALNIFHKNRFTSDGQATPRKRLAERIIAIKLRELALREGKLEPWVPRTGEGPGEEEPEQEEMV
jgi:hypothetical protein